MISVSLNSITNPQNNVGGAGTSKPLSFVDWYNRNSGISFGDSDKQYKNYVNSFYTKIDANTASSVSKLKNDYISLIKRLSILFKNDADFARYSAIDFDSTDDLKIAIPKYAEKLKNIALYYVSKREDLKRKKLEYSMVGSEGGLNTIIYNKLAGSFTNAKAPFSNENPLITISPQFSSIKDDFSIEIEELYNTVDPFYETESLNPFACIFNDTCSSLVDIPLSGLIHPLQNIYCVDDSGRIETTLQAAYNKYVGTDINYMSGGYYREYVKNLDISLSTGDNFFYWFSGRNVYDIPEGTFKDVKINDITWNSTGNSTDLNSDIIFLTVGNILNESAWYQDTEYMTTLGVMSCIVVDGKIFKFPFCNFGASAFGGEWSGPSIVDIADKAKEFYPSEEDFLKSQNSIHSLYWNAFSSISTVIGINVQDLTLGKSNGYASNDYQNADKIIISEDGSSQQLYNNHTTGWLFNFNQSQLPIVPGKTNILFPIQTYTDSSELFFDYSAGTSIPLSTLNVEECFCGAVAGESIPFADMIVKNATVCGPEVEGAWLRSPSLQQFKYIAGGECSCIDSLKTFSTGWEFISGGAQPGTSFKCNPGEYIRFTWTGENININNVAGFTGFSHDDACPYKIENHATSIVDKNFLDDSNKSLFEKWKICTCQAVHYSPFGHNQSNLEHFKITPDFIVKDTGFPNNFNKNTWKGTDGKNYLGSVDCARFYPELIERDVGWGRGYWGATGTSSFILEKGQTYIYHRAVTNNCSFDSPYFIINHKQNKFNFKGLQCVGMSNIPIWMKAVKNSDGEWEDAGEISDMVLQFGDFISYDHKSEISEQRIKLLYNGEDISSLSGSSVVLDSKDESISFISTTTQIPSINFLIKIPLDSNPPYWGEYSGSRTTIVNEYLHTYQPKPLNRILSQFDIIEYKFGCGSACFLWEQPLTFSTYHPIKQWNKVLIDPYVNSEILSYLNSEQVGCAVPVYNCESDCNYNFYSECYQRCLTNKTGITATNEKSDITFNTELSGIPAFITYVAKTDFTQTISVIDISNGLSSEYVPVVSGLLVAAEYPWRNILNGDRSLFVVEETGELLTSEQLGFYTPSMVSMNRYEVFGNDYGMSSPAGTIQSFSYDNYIGDILKLNNISDEYITYSTFGKTNGTIDIKYQNLTPYNSIFTEEFLGLYEDNMYFSPWDSYKWPDDSIKFKKDYNCVSDWFTSQLALTGDVWNWDGDIFGNNYYLVMNTLDYSTIPADYGSIFIKKTNKDVDSMLNCLSSVFIKYKNISFGTSEEFTYLTTEDSINITTEDGSYIIL